METKDTVTSLIQYKDTIHMDKIFKVCILNDNNVISKLIVFQGSNKPINKNSDIFSDYEKLHYQSIDLDIIPSTMQIHPDDSINHIKKKIINQIGDSTLSYGELYMFSKKEINLHLHQIYMEITNQDTEPLSTSVIGQLLINLGINDKNTIEYFLNLKKDTISFVDFQKGMVNYTNNFEISIPIGRKFSNNRNFLFSANPYNVIHNNPIIYQPSNNNLLLSFENHLLLSYGNIIDNTIYVTLAKDVSLYSERNSIVSDYFYKLYFPLLANKGILSVDDLNQQQATLVKDTKQHIKPTLLQSFENIDSFYNIYNSKNTELPYNNIGITDFHFTLHPVSKTIFPLDIVFKQLHTNDKIPLIKYNPGSRREPIYRLYSTKKTKDGKKIPELSRTQIINYTKLHNKNRQLIFVINHTIHKNKEILFLYINHNGNIMVKGDSKIGLSVNNLNNIIIQTINPVLDKINNLLESSGYSISLFKDIYDERIEYNNLNFTCEIKENKTIKSNDLTVILSNIFHIYKADVNKGAILRYKRVENYKEMNAVNSVITYVYKSTNDLNEVKKALSNNFSYTEQEINQHITTYLNNHIVINGNYVNKSIDIAENPGFPCSIKTSNAFATPEIIIEVQQIDSINYIDIIKTYFEVFLLITQFPDKSNISKEELISKFSKSSKKEPINEHDNVITTDGNLINTNVFNNITEEQQNEAIFYDDYDDENDESDESDDNASETSNNALLFSDDDDDDDLMVGGNTFFDKMKKLEPTLFRVKKEGKYESYARICPNQSSRQPVILTKDELDNIDVNTYDVAMPYGTDKDNEYWYMCPRYWCLQTNKPMTEQQVNDGECGGKIIPHRSNEAPPGHYIYEFTDNRQHMDENNNYRKHYPGFVSTDKHPDYCLPCCFKDMDSKQQKDRREKCGVTNDKLMGRKDVINKLLNISNDKQDDSVTNTKQDKNVRIGANILSFDKYPISPSRWGFLPLSAELFLQTDNSTAVSKNNPTLIKQNETPLLRYGVEYSINQSFIACIADLYAYEKKINVPTIKEMRTNIINSVTIDIFVHCNNSSLVSIFKPKKRYPISDSSIEEYKDTEIYKNLNLKNNSQYNFLKETIASYDNFIKYLNDDDTYIDHTYLWDIISSPDTGLFNNGINIALLEIIDNDITDNISLVCPTNSYSNTLFDTAKGSCIILKQNEFYEPIYKYGKPQKVVKIFYKDNTNILLTDVFNMINKTTNSYCKPKNSMPQIYDYKQNKPAKVIYDILVNNKFYVSKQVNNYNGKIVALMVSSRENDTKEVYIPTFPSTPIKNKEKLQMIYIDDVKWLDYETTKMKLTQISNNTNNLVLSMPAFKVIEDELIVGLFTETNQFIYINSPVENLIEDQIPEYKVNGYKDNQYIEANKSFAIDNTKDEIRTQTIRNLSLETQFYNQFRSKIRVLLNDYKYKEIRDKIVEIIYDKQLLYKVKMRSLDILIRHLLKPYVSFVDFNEDVLKQVNNLNAIIDKEDINNICLKNSKNSICVPNKHLVTGNDNDLLYYNRFCDELIRYNRIRTFILDQNKYLNTGEFEYNINNNEIILLQSLITPENLDNLVPMPSNQYVNHITYDFADPRIPSNLKPGIDVPLSNQYTNFSHLDLDILQKECLIKQDKFILKTNKKWQEILNDDAIENITKDATHCSYYTLLYIIKKHLNIDTNINEIKKQLCKYYKPLINKYLVKICEILKQEGKSYYSNRLKQDEITLETMIMNENYNLTSIDLWIYASSTNLPIILFDTDKNLTISLAVDWLVLGGNLETDHFYFVRVVNDKQFNLITPPNMLKDIRGFDNLTKTEYYWKSIQSFTTSIEEYKPPVKKIKLTKKAI